MSKETPNNIDISNYQLFHYTSVDKLALILKNQSIRFMPLNTLDDPDECLTADGNNVTHCFFVSCWTNEKTESIPMWKMYASEFAGVRIGLPLFPFKEKSTVEVDKERPVLGLEFTKKEGIVSPELMFAGQKSMLREIEYTSDRAKLYPEVLTEEQAEDEHGKLCPAVSIAIAHIGKHKAKSWSFQKEYRYQFSALRIRSMEKGIEVEEDLRRCAQQFLEHDFEQPFPFLDLELSDEAFSKMEVMLSPKISEGNCVVVKTLLEKFNPNARLEESGIRLR